MAEHPYRAALARAEDRRVVVAEVEQPPLFVKVRAWSDGTLRMRLGAATPFLSRIAFGVVCGVFGILALCLAWEAPFALTLVLALISLFFAAMAAGRFRSELISVSQVAVSRRRSFRTRGEVRLLADVSSVVITGDGEAARLDLQVGRERLQLAKGLNYDEATLRWVAQRLRRAIEAAR